MYFVVGVFLCVSRMKFVCMDLFLTAISVSLNSLIRIPVKGGWLKPQYWLMVKTSVSLILFVSFFLSAAPPPPSSCLPYSQLVRKSPLKWLYNYELVPLSLAFDRMWSVSQTQHLTHCEKMCICIISDTMTHQQTQTDQANKEIREFEIILIIKTCRGTPTKTFPLVWSESHQNVSFSLLFMCHVRFFRLLNIVGL